MAQARSIGARMSLNLDQVLDQVLDLKTRGGGQINKNPQNTLQITWGKRIQRGPDYMGSGPHVAVFFARCFRLHGILDPPCNLGDKMP